MPNHHTSMYYEQVNVQKVLHWRVKWWRGTALHEMQTWMLPRELIREGWLPLRKWYDTAWKVAWAAKTCKVLEIVSPCILITVLYQMPNIIIIIKHPPRKIPLKVHTLWLKDVPWGIPNENGPGSRKCLRVLCIHHDLCISSCSEKKNDANLLNLMQVASDISLILTLKVSKHPKSHSTATQQRRKETWPREDKGIQKCPPPQIYSTYSHFSHA